MSPLQIKLAIYAAMALIVIGAYFSWEHHIKSIQREIDRAEVAKRDAKTAETSAKIMAEEKAKVEQSNKDQTERLKNAIKIYAQRATDLNDDVANLTQRMRNNRAPTSCSQNSVPGTGNDNTGGKGRDNKTDSDIARAAIELANMCEMQINRMKVSE